MSKSAARLRMRILANGVSFFAAGAVAPALAQTPADLPPVLVASPGPISLTPLNVDAVLQSDATAAQGYRPEFLSGVGPLGAKPIIDTPYSIDVISRELLENTQAQSTDDVFKLDPFTQNVFPVNRGNPFSVNIRGFATSETTLDNMRLWNTSVIDIEGMERVEVVRGLSGFLYGAADPGGLINFVVKRPTAAPFAQLTVGDYGIGPFTGGAGYVHGDFGGPIDKEGRFGYRINIVGQSGDTAVDQQRLQRSYFSAALDWHVAPEALAQVNVFHSYYRVDAPDPFWFYGGTAIQGQAPSAQRSWSQPWAYYRNEQNGAEAKLTWKPNDILTLRGGFLYIHSSQPEISVNNLVFSNDGTYSQSLNNNAAGDLTTLSGYGFIDADFETGPLKHKVTGGYFTQRYQSVLPEDAASFASTTGNFNFGRPYYAAMPSFDAIGTRPSSLFFTRSNQNAVLGDQIDYGPLSVIAGVTHAQIQTSDYTYLPPIGVSRTLESQYDEGRFTPSASVLFKVTPWLSTYATYIEGLEAGDTAPVGALNAGETFPPSLDRQYEVGAKANVGATLLTLAFFDIDKAYAFLDSDNVFKSAGREEHKGVEFGASGKVLPEWTVFGGVTFLDPRVTNDPTLDGLQPINVSSRMAKVYSEYALPFVPGLTLTGGVYYYGKYAATVDNTQYLPGYATGDLGFRYETKLNGIPLTARFNVSNVTNHSYWMSNRFVGAPREISFSLATRF
ncbi:TonB-dependent siderophore receptor [Methylocella silvestris BL2]|uniref:TonB-dependent siderophore receptor n=1 Tax=Methylocella silvestris (strain DSM 15510 / CIP 108128 / LMG 27833 / NCIMB 13906 / BL2) TaxID=395965 RepID=B8ETK8_METSB|nr:TonB-dependent siderophore receptor [Methylocella silvestris]ACK52360.1 TonB-dependent siderophore receptor [Methylocella silvestris BL2]